jgi:hypothetical protein
VTFDADLEAEGTWEVKEILPDGWVSTTDLSCTFDVAFPADADETFTCNFDNDEMGRVDLLKLTNGVQDPSQIWNFELYEGPEGFGGTLVKSDATPPPLVDFDNVNLDPNMTYTLCETGIPPSWSVQWALDENNSGGVDEGETLPFVGCADQLTGDGEFQVYDPDPNCGGDGAVNDTRCVDFMPDHGMTTHFILDNSRPGGEPRTPGYWKNWNTCSRGNQVQTAAKNGGPAEGWFLLDDLIPTTVGNLEITTCEDGVSILDQRDLESGRKRASDAAYTLAMHLLAAKLNLAAGADPCGISGTVADADALLTGIGFDGTGKYLRPKNAEYQTALDLAYLLDHYNNGLLCIP